MSHTPVRFAHLSPAKQAAVARFIAAGALTAFGKYDAIDGQTAKQRAPALIELGGEDDILTSSKRLRMVNLMRQQMRNAPITRTIDQQRRVNVVGEVGGKLTISLYDKDGGQLPAAKQAQDWFNDDWAPQAEFTDGLCFNELLKLSLSAGDNNGDLVMLFDNGVLAPSIGGTGRIRAFESDEIANLTASAFRARFPADSGYTQSQGVIRDRLGRTCGVIVSTACRGLQEFPADKAFVLMRDPMADRRDAFFTFNKRSWRFNQGRGVSPSSSSVNTLTDLYNLVGSETQAALLNAKMVGQLVDSSDQPAESPVPTEYRPTETAPDGDSAPTGDDATATAEDIADANPPTLTLDQMDAIGAFYDIMPPKLKMELLDTKRPNEKVIDFVNWLAGQATGVYGLGRIYATLNPEASYTAFRGAQCLSWPSMSEAQKDKERNECDWAARNALPWAVSRGLIPELPAGWKRALAWQWPEMPEVNIVDEQTALNKRLANLDVSYRERLGPDWKNKLQHRFNEIKFFRENGVLHPAEQTVSGGIAAPANTAKEG